MSKKNSLSYNYIKKLHWIFKTQIGIDPLKLLKSLKNLFKFLKHYFYFKKNYKGEIELKPCLQDYNDSAGNQNSEYFIQDLFTSQYIFDEKPKTLLDIGSRIDGYILAVASFRNLDVMDTRPIKKIIKNVNFIQQDLLNPKLNQLNKYDLVTCLHTIEHIGLGRYGDILDVDGPKKALKNISLLLKKNGKLIISTPVGKDKILFNSNIIFEPKKILNLLEENNFSIIEIYIINRSSELLKIDDIDSFLKYKEFFYNLTILVCRKIS